MIEFDSNAALAGAFAAGVGLHIFVFRTGEWDLAAIKLMGTFALLDAGLTASLLQFLPESYPSPGAAFQTASTLVSTAIFGVTASMLTYRGLFHRLNRFPGPILARFSNFYPTALSAKDLHLCLEVQQLHAKYGDIVRLGPSELSINHPQAVAAIHGPTSKCVKGPWYNILHPMVSLQMIRDKKEHIRRRRIWDRGFSAKALRDYEPRVAGYTEQLLNRIEETKGKPLNVTDWYNFYSFDVMGDLAFGKSFDMLRDGVKHFFMTSLHMSMTLNGLFSHLMWLYPIFKGTPGINFEYVKFQKWLHQQVSERRKMNPDRPDVFSWLLESHESLEKPTAQDELNLIGDAYLIAVAGSDTTAATLTALSFELARKPECLKALQKEVDEYFDKESGAESGALSKLAYLDAAINEALRLHPPVPSGLQRMTPPEGLRIGDVFIPGNSIVQIPSYTMYRDSRNFDQPDEFIPERWTTRPELTKEAGVFVPFSTGRYSCIGKHLGLMEVRYVMAQIVRRYNLELAPEQSAQAFVDAKKDTFTLQLGRLDLVFQPRADV